MNDLINITIQNGRAVVSSLEVAQKFGKQHKNVLQTIGNLTAENSALTQMFYETTYTAGTGKTYPMYLMNRDGFSLLAMGFTGKEALEWKVKYINAFNQMEQQISGGALQLENRLVQLLESTNAVLQSLVPMIQNNATERRPVELVHEKATPFHRAAFCTHQIYGVFSPIPKVVEVIGKKDRDHYYVRYLDEECGRYESVVIHRNWLLPYNEENRKRVLGY